MSAKPPMTVGSLFAGIGGFDLGFERAGFEISWQVEIDEFCRKVLAKHYPTARRHGDINTFPPSSQDDWRVDVLVGGFPCQDISTANPWAEGITGARSGLWDEYWRIIRLLRPSYVVIENVSALLARGLRRVLWCLAKSGYDAEWQVISAQSMGGGHRRGRVFVVAYPSGKRWQTHGLIQNGPFETLGEKKAARLRNWPGKAQSGGSCLDRIRWIPDSGLCRVADGVPDRLDRYHGLGNSIVPYIAEWIATRIREDAESQQETTGI